MDTAVLDGVMLAVAAADGVSDDEIDDPADTDAAELGDGDGVTDGDGVGVDATGAKAMPRNSVFGEAAATYEKHNVHDENAVPVAWLSS
jgi:hypothetical protein